MHKSLSTFLLGVLKQYLRELPEPLLTFDLYPDFMAATQLWVILKSISYFCLKYLISYKCLRCVNFFFLVHNGILRFGLLKLAYGIVNIIEVKDAFATSSSSVWNKDYYLIKS